LVAYLQLLIFSRSERTRSRNDKNGKKGAAPTRESMPLALGVKRVPALTQEYRAANIGFET